METLKPCPFCAGAAVFSRIPQQGFSVLCNDCGAIVLHCGSSDRNTLGAQWNTRVFRPNFSQQNAPVPCPFCASRASVKNLAKDASVLQCERCGMMVSFAQSASLADTVAKWNKRK